MKKRTKTSPRARTARAAGASRPRATAPTDSLRAMVSRAVRLVKRYGVLGGRTDCNCMECSFLRDASRLLKETK